MAKSNKPLKKKISNTISELKAAAKSTKRAKKEYRKAVEACKEKNNGLRIDFRNAKHRERELKGAYKKLKKELAATMKKEEQVKKKAANPKKKEKVKNTSEKKASKKTASKSTKKSASKKDNPIKAKAKNTRAKVPKNPTTPKVEKVAGSIEAAPAKSAPTQNNGKLPPKRPAPKWPPANTVPKSTNDNLKVIEGIGPAIERHLKAAGIHTFGQLARTSVNRVREILIERGGSRYSVHNPATWAQQARLAKAGKMDELKKLQQEWKEGQK